jgi:5'(3')-deoxyribonucleotidase
VKKKPIVLLDCDGVLADYVGGALKLVHQVTDKRFVHRDVVDYDFAPKLLPDAAQRAEYTRLMCQPGFCASLEPCEGAVEGVRALSEVGEIYIVTASSGPNPTWAHERDRWLLEHFGINHHRVIHTHAKQRVHGHVFVDDRPEYVEAWGFAGQRVLWAQPHNAGKLKLNIQRHNDWELLRFVVASVGVMQS